ncbi:MAG TPA: hypothetical protein VGX23_14320 [Actinocrinis sp.]|nr:hypothetical protein [Actinocrinis sp.]
MNEGQPVHEIANEFFERLVAVFPQLAEDYEIHVENEGQVLAHVFLSIDVVPAALAAYSGQDGDYQDLDWRALLTYLDDTFPTADPYLQKAIVTSFLMDLPWPTEPGYGIIEHLGPVLAAKFHEARPAG